MAVTTDERREQLLTLRRKLRVTQLELASAANLNNSMLSRWEHGYLRLGADAVDRIEAFLADELESIKAIEVPKGASE